MHLPTKQTEDMASRLTTLRLDRESGRGGRLRLEGIGARFLRLDLALLALFLLALSIFTFFWWDDADEAPVGAEATRSAELTSTGTASSASSEWVVAGYLVARRRSLVGSEVTATLSDLLVEEGDTVAKGQVIARLDNTLATADLRIAQSRVDAATSAIEAVEAELAEARQALDRTRPIAERGFASRAALDGAEAKVAALSSRSDQARAEREVAVRESQRLGTLVARHQIRAPFAGVVTGCDARIGETISPMSFSEATTEGVCTIVDPASFEIELEIPENMVSRVSVGAPARFYLDAYPQDDLSATVRSIAPVANRQKSTIAVRLALEEIDPRLRPNMSVRVNLQTAPVENEK